MAERDCEAVEVVATTSNILRSEEERATRAKELNEKEEARVKEIRKAKGIREPGKPKEPGAKGGSFLDVLCLPCEKLCSKWCCVALGIGLIGTSIFLFATCPTDCPSGYYLKSCTGNNGQSYTCTSNNGEYCEDGTLDQGYIAGAVITLIFGLLLIFFAFWCSRPRRE